MYRVSLGLMPLTLCVVLTASAVGAQTPTSDGEARKLKNPVAASAASTSAGAATYKKYCAFCHADDAKGDGALAPKDSHPPDLTDAKWDHGGTDGEIFMYIKNGGGPKSVMKPFGAKIQDPDIWNVVNFLRSQSKPAR